MKPMGGAAPSGSSPGEILSSGAPHHGASAGLLVYNPCPPNEQGIVLWGSDSAGQSEIRRERQPIGSVALNGTASRARPKRSGRDARDEQMQAVEAALRRRPVDFGLTGDLWDGKTLSAYVKRQWDVSLGARQCQRIFRRLGFRLRNPRSVVVKADPAEQERVENSAGRQAARTRTQRRALAVPVARSARNPLPCPTRAWRA